MGGKVVETNWTGRYGDITTRMLHWRFGGYSVGNTDPLRFLDPGADTRTVLWKFLWQQCVDQGRPRGPLVRCQEKREGDGTVECMVVFLSFPSGLHPRLGPCFKHPSIDSCLFRNCLVLQWHKTIKQQNKCNCYILKTFPCWPVTSYCEEATWLTSEESGV